MGSRLEKNSESVRKRIEKHSFQDEEGDEYEGSKFGGFEDYFRRKKIKLQNLDAELRATSDKPPIFKGIVAQVNGYTQPSLSDLHALIVSHGGGFMQYLNGKTTVTHIIASSLTPKKAMEFRQYRIVKPAWIVDSVAAGKLLPWDAYRVLDPGAGQKTLGFEGGRMASQLKPTQRGYREQTNTSWYTSQLENIADEIDDENGAQFPSTQTVIMNGMDEFADAPGKQVVEATSEKRKAAEQSSSSPEDFEVTASLEDALDNEPKQLNQSTAKGKEKVTEPKSSADYNVSPSLENALNDAESGQFGHGKTSTGRQSPTPPFNLPQASMTFNVMDKRIDAVSPLQTTPSNAKRQSHEPESPPPTKKKPGDMTAEEHNAILLADPRMKKSSTANADFIKQYYAESRLHHLSSWKADLKSRFQQMAAEKSASQRQHFKRKPGSRRYVMHVDFDSFFCAVSLKRAPEYVDRPTVVAHGSGTGSEIASCNYPARAFGVKNGMWMKKALELCSDIKVLPYDFPAYEEASKAFYEAIIDVGGIVQSVSIDEALVDISTLVLAAGGSDGVGVQEGSIWREQERADEIGRALRARIKDKTGCAVSVGIGGNILLAKVALRKAKPAGQHQVKPEEIMDFIGELSVLDLPGVAYSIGGKLEEIGVRLVKDVRQFTKDRLMTVLGPKTGEKIWDYARGIDRVEVGEQVVRKSVSAEVNWGIRFISQPDAEEFVQNLCIELERRLLNERVKGRQLTMKIMRKSADAPLDPPKHLGHGKCDTFNKSIVLGVATSSAQVLGGEAVSILRGYGFSPGELRGLGVQLTKLEPIKSSVDTLPDGSQRRIDFGKPAAPKAVNAEAIHDPKTPKKPKDTPLSRDRFGINTRVLQNQMHDFITPPKPRFNARLPDSDDPIEFDSPKKPKDMPIHPAAAIARINAADQSARKLLNLTGTQFIIPSQIDPEVLKELPKDIRAKLMAQGRKPESRDESPAPRSRSESPSGEGQYKNLPSQLDVEVFEALPKEMKAEILASYENFAGPSSPGPSRACPQSVLPQSPRKVRYLAPMKTTPVKKRGRGRPPGPLIRKTKPMKDDPHSSHTQSNFVTTKDRLVEARDVMRDSEEGYSSDTLDPDFLLALPEDVRTEVTAEHKRKLLARKGGLSIANASKNRRPPESDPMVQRKLRLPPRNPRPTFTTQELSTLPQLRDTLRAWYGEFANDGPHPDDVSAFSRYLRRVILDEKDVSKVVGVVRWIEWLVDESDEENDGTKAWSTALCGIKEHVQAAMKERKLGKLEL